MKLKSDKGGTVLALLITKLWEDSELKKKFKKDPVKILEAEGLEVPKGVAIKILQNTKKIKYIPLDRDFDAKKNHKNIHTLFSLITPIPENVEIRLVQNSKNTYHILLPQRPPKKLRTNLSGIKLINLAAATELKATDLHELASIASNFVITVDIYSEIEVINSVVVYCQ